MRAQFLANLRWLKSSAPDLYYKINSNLHAAIEWLDNSQTADIDLYVDSKCILPSLNALMREYYAVQLQSPDLIAIPPVANDNDSLLNIDQILGATVGSTSCTLLQHIAPSRSQLIDLAKIQSPIRNFICLGSLALLPILQNLSSCQNICSITLFESSFEQLGLFLGMIDLQQSILNLKKMNISLSIHVDDSYTGLQDLFINQFNRLNPFILHGSQIYRSPFPVSHLSKLYTWIHSPEGLGQLVTGMLGFTTDELNQVQQAVFNSKKIASGFKLPSQKLCAEKGAVLVSSGPSLDSCLPWLREHQEHLFIIAAGSSIGSLVRNQITPNAVVLLERNQGVYELFTELLFEGSELTSIDLFACSTVDPRIPPLFNRHFIFHRPYSAAASLFHQETDCCLSIGGPQVINSTLEIALRLGYRKLLLMGCDFGAFDKNFTRSKNSLGIDADFSARSMQIPVKGNLGRTVFSSDDLLVSKMLFERTANAHSDLMIYRCGMGAGFDLIDSHELASPEELTVEALASFKSTQVPQIDTSRLRSCSMEDVSAFFGQASIHLDDFYSEIRDYLYSSSYWSHKTSLFLSKYVSRVDATKYTPEAQFVIDLISQPVFMLVHDLYVITPDLSTQWPQQVNIFMSSLEKLKCILKKYLSISSRFALAESLDWDPSVVRHLYSYYASKNDMDSPCA